MSGDSVGNVAINILHITLDGIWFRELLLHPLVAWKLMPCFLFSLSVTTLRSPAEAFVHKLSDSLAELVSVGPNMGSLVTHHCTTQLQSTFGIL